MSAASNKTVKLLLAEDNPMVRDLVAKGLEPFCDVLIVADGADALAGWLRTRDRTMVEAVMERARAFGLVGWARTLGEASPRD